MVWFGLVHAIPTGKGEGIVKGERVPRMRHTFPFALAAPVLGLNLIRCRATALPLAGSRSWSFVEFLRNLVQQPLIELPFLDFLGFSLSI